MLSIHLFGPLRLTYDGEALRFAALPKTLPLLAYLLINRETPLPRAALAFTLWPDASEESARNNLRRHLYELRRVLPPAPDDAPWVLAGGTTVQWNPAAPCWLDVTVFEAACRDPERLAEAVALYRDDLLPSVDEEWLLFERERLRALLLAALAQLIDQRRAAGDFPAAIDYAATLLRREPLREDVVRTLMTLRAESGDLPGALLEYRRFEQEVRVELDVPPTAETSALYDSLARSAVTQEALRHAHPAVAPAPAAALPAAPESPRHNLPAQLTSFVGRSQEIADIRAMLARSQDPVRLLTLVGPGGSGKTRLALEAAARLVDAGSFGDGVFFVPLAALTDSADVAAAIASALHLAAQGGAAPAELLAPYLRQKQLLLVLDNFEHVAAAAPLLADLLAAAPGLAVLATSRVPLRLYGEQEYLVAPLPLPDLADLPAFDDLARNPAVELFLIRSRAVNPAYMLRREDAATVAEICARLDGLPLAIELAAAHSKLYPPQALLARLSRRLSFLENRVRQAERRHQTLRATLDWSYHLLGATEQTLLAQLAVFAQSFTLEAAEAVCSLDGETDIFVALAALCDHSMVQPAQTGRGVRFVMLTTVHEYATSLLADDARERLQQRHAAFYAAFAQEAGRAIYGAQQAEWLAAVRDEEDNLRAALRWTLAPGSASMSVVDGLHIARGLARFWQISGRIVEGRTWFAQAAAVLDAAPVGDQVEVLGQAGLFAQLQGDHAAAFAFHERALALARSTGDETLIAFALYSLGSSAGRAGDAARAAELLSECLALRRRLFPATVTEAQLALTLNNLAVSYVNVGDFAQAEALYVESLGLKRKNDDKVGIATALVNLGDLAMRRGDYARAAALKRESIELRVELNDQLGLTKALDQIAELAVLREDYARAATLFAACTAAYDRLHAQRTAHIAAELQAYLKSIQQHLSPADFARATALGERMGLDEAIRFALATARG